MSQCQLAIVKLSSRHWDRVNEQLQYNDNRQDLRKLEGKRGLSRFADGCFSGLYGILRRVVLSRPADYRGGATFAFEALIARPTHNAIRISVIAGAAKKYRVELTASAK